MWPVLQSVDHTVAYNEWALINIGGALRQDSNLMQAKSPPGLKLNSWSSLNLRTDLEYRTINLFLNSYQIRMAKHHTTAILTRWQGRVLKSQGRHAANYIQPTPIYLNATSIRLMWIAFVKYKEIVYALGLACGVGVVRHFRKPQKRLPTPTEKTHFWELLNNWISTLDHKT